MLIFMYLSPFVMYLMKELSGFPQLFAALQWNLSEEIHPRKPLEWYTTPYLPLQELLGFAHFLFDQNICAIAHTKL